jgi:hypothetical protein
MQRVRLDKHAGTREDVTTLTGNTNKNRCTAGNRGKT